MTLADIDIDPAPITAWLALAIMVSTTIVGLAAFYIASKLAPLRTRLDAQDATLADLTATLAQQFGGNSGGIREAVNAIRATSVELKAGQIAQAARLDEHIDFHLRGDDHH